MLPVDATAIRMFLHVLAATVWVGGQLTLVGLLPVLRAAGGDTPRRAARAFNRLAWPALAVLVATGIWNVVAVDVADAGGRYAVTLAVKVGAVAASAVGTVVHIRAKRPSVLAIGGAVGLLAALAALFLGVLLSS